MKVGTHASKALEVRKDSSRGEWSSMTGLRRGRGRPLVALTVLHTAYNSGPESLVNNCI